VQFTPQELAMISVLKRQRDTWPALRVALAVMSLILVAFASWEFFSSGLSGVSLVLLIVGVGAASHTYRNWHGQVEASLLLRLLEQQDGGPSA